jgi:tRNA 2-thiouridine synthesizing protein E
MPTRDINGQTIEFDDEGFMVDRTAWNRDIAAVLATEEGIETLTDRHFDVIDFMRKEVEEKGTAPSIRRLNKLNVVPTKELYQLFPGGPAKKAAKIAGLKKPEGCI